MDFRMLRTFVCVAELTSFTKAADALGYAQSTVSFQIRQLEEELGTKLFERVRRTVTLTERGRAVLRYAQQIGQLEREMGDALRAEARPAGRVRLATADSLCPVLLGPRYSAFRRTYPDIALTLIAADTEEMFHLLNHNEADLVLTLDSHIYNTEYVIADERRVGVHFVAAAGHPLAKARGLRLRDLTAEPFFLTEGGMSYRRLLDERLAEQSLEVHPVLEMGDVYRICRLVEQGLGLSFLPDYATDAAVAAGTAARLDVADGETEVWRQLLYHREKWLSPAIRAVMTYCLQC